MHTNVTVVTLAGALKTVLLALLVAVVPGFHPDAVLTDAIGTIFLAGLCAGLPGDFMLQNKIGYYTKREGGRRAQDRIDAGDGSAAERVRRSDEGSD